MTVGESTHKETSSFLPKGGCRSITFILSPNQLQASPSAPNLNQHRWRILAGTNARKITQTKGRVEKGKVNGTHKRGAP
jgi:hypothetical protein